MQIFSIIRNPAETASSFSGVISSKYPNLHKNLTENYSKVTDKFSEHCPDIISSTLNNGTALICSLPGSIEDKVNSYTSMFEPVDADGSEEREIRTPNENLGENVISLKDEREEIVMHILNLYSCKPSNECFKHYDDDVIFDDPFIYTTGLPNFKAQFYGLQKIFVKSITVNYKILENTPNTMRIDLTQKYVLPFIGRAVTQNSEIILEFNENKIVKHIDCWNGKPTGEEGILRKGLAKLISAVISIPEY